MNVPSAVAAKPLKRPRIYQLFLRQFSNVCESRTPRGTLAENGVGRFADLDDRALRALRDLGITHVWLMGVLRQATRTGYPALGLPPDDPDLVKGQAGSPFAVRDCFDVCPDYATDPARRTGEFRALVDRMHRRGLRVLVDFVPNHVARSHRSVVRPDLEFGVHDDRSRFFAPANHFYYLPGEGPLRLPQVREGVPPPGAGDGAGGGVGNADGDGWFERERGFGRVTGNNVVSWHPGPGDWYETVKLNYGHDFTRGRSGPRAYPTAEQPDLPIPDTWLRMDAVLAHWQGLGVDGFRCDMAHWIPMEFWRWALARARARRPGAWFLAEAYDDDPNKLVDGDVLTALVEAGFDAVYDAPSYRVLKGMYDGPKWANDLDAVAGAGVSRHSSLRYAENHDEVRLAARGHWGGWGPAVGRPVSAVLFALGRGPVLIHNGQEVGEPADGTDGRTSLFDYGQMPELAKWVNGHRYDGGRLSEEQRSLRDGYARLLEAAAHPALARGEFLPLNPANLDNPRYGRLPGEAVSGHWLYACLRREAGGGPGILAVANLHPLFRMEGVRIVLPVPARELLGVAGPGTGSTGRMRFSDRLEPAGGLRFSVSRADLAEGRLDLPPLAPLTAHYLEFR